MGAKNDTSTTKYNIVARFEIQGVVETPDIVGAIYGQTSGLLSEDLDIRELQKSGRIGRISVDLASREGKTRGSIIIPSSLPRTETAILAATIETVDRVGPCTCTIKLGEIVDVRIDKRKSIVDRAAEIVRQWDQNVSPFSSSIKLEVEKSSKVGSVIKIGADGFAAGPAFEKSKKIILVEGRADVVTLLKMGIDNTIAVNGTSVSLKLVELIKKKTITAFLDGDRGGDLILKELLQVAHVEYVARAPKGKEVEDLNKDEVNGALKKCVSLEKAVFLTGTDEGLTVKKFLQKSTKTGRRQVKPSYVKPETKREAKSFERPSTYKPRQPSSTSERRPRDTKSFQPRREYRPTDSRTSYSQTRRSDSTSRRATSYRDSETRPPRRIIRKIELPEYLNKTVESVKQKLEAVVFEEENKESLRIPAAEIFEKLDEIKKAEIIVIDGIITQRLLERAHNKGIAMVIGARLGEISKKPESVKIVEFRDL